ncbi:hypothetical protein [Flavobacterium sp. 3-210]
MKPIALAFMGGEILMYRSQSVSRDSKDLEEEQELNHSFDYAQDDIKETA